jgi:hypothetical protein
MHTGSFDLRCEPFIEGSAAIIWVLLAKEKMSKLVAEDLFEGGRELIRFDLPAYLRGIVRNINAGPAAGLGLRVPLVLVKSEDAPVIQIRIPEHLDLLRPRVSCLVEGRIVGVRRDPLDELAGKVVHRNDFRARSIRGDEPEKCAQQIHYIVWSKTRS